LVGGGFKESLRREIAEDPRVHLERECSANQTLQALIAFGEVLVGCGKVSIREGGGLSWRGIDKLRGKKSQRLTRRHRVRRGIAERRVMMSGRTLNRHQ